MIFIDHTEILNGDAAIVSIKGPLDSNTSPGFEDYINQLLEKKIYYILLDGENIEYVSSSGIGVTLFIQKKVSEKNGYFVVYNLSLEISSLYGVLGFDKIFRIADDEINAMEIMDRQIEMRRGEEYHIEEGDKTGSPETSPDQKKQPESIPQNDNNRIIECRHCRSNVRVKLSGDYLCPFCRMEFHYDADNPEVVLKEKKNAGFSPFVVECSSCGNLVRVKAAGSYLCPSCNADFDVNEDQTVVF